MLGGLALREMFGWTLYGFERDFVILRWSDGRGGGSREQVGAGDGEGCGGLGLILWMIDERGKVSEWTRVGKGVLRYRKLEVVKRREILLYWVMRLKLSCFFSVFGFEILKNLAVEGLGKDTESNAAI